MAQGIILSLGSVNADFQVRVEEKPGSTTTMLGHSFMRLSGGKAANVAYLAKRLGVPATLIAHVGNDDLQKQALGSLREIDVDLRYVKAIDNVSTAVSMIAVPPNGKKHIILASNANDVWQEEEAEEVRQAIRQAPVGSVLVVDYEVAPFIVEHAIKAAREKGFPIILDPSPTGRVDQDLFSQINYIVPDVSEAEGLTGINPDSVDNAVKAARELVKRGIETAIVKLSEGGCVVTSSEGTLHVPSVPVKVVDATGAGDAFTGALAVSILEKKSLAEAASFATAASLFTVSGCGSQPAYPSRADLTSLFDQVINKIQTING